MKKYSCKLSVVLVALLLVLTACGKADEQAADSGDAGGTGEVVFGEFSAQTIDGTEVTQDIFAEAELTMVNIWGTFCGPCINEMPDLGELNREYKEQGFQIVGMISDVNEPGDETAKEIIEATQADYTHLVSSPDLQSGVLGEIQAVPTTIFVNEKGEKVGRIYPGANSKEGWEEVIKALLEESQDESQEGNQK